MLLKLNGHKFQKRDFFHSKVLAPRQTETTQFSVLKCIAPPPPASLSRALKLEGVFLYWTKLKLADRLYWTQLNLWTWNLDCLLGHLLSISSWTTSKLHLLLQSDSINLENCNFILDWSLTAMIFHLKKSEKCWTDKNITLLVDAVKIVGYPSIHIIPDIPQQTPHCSKLVNCFSPKWMMTQRALVINRNNTADIDCINHMSRSRSTNNDLQVF